METFMKENTMVILPMAAFCKKSTLLASPKYRNHNWVEFTFYLYIYI